MIDAHSDPPAEPSGSNPQDPAEQDAPPGLSPQQLAEHPRTWKFIPSGSEESWVTTARPILEAYTRASAEGDDGLRNQLVEHLLLLPSNLLVKKRAGRRKTIKRLNKRLDKYHNLIRSQPDPTRPLQPMDDELDDSVRQASADPFTAKVHRAVSYARRGFLGRAAK